MLMNKLVAGTRRSLLARTQTGMVMTMLSDIFPDTEIDEKIIVTKGDRILDSPLSKIGDKGLFTREIEEQLIGGEIDFAVHSFKDLPTELPDGLEIGAVLAREKPDDVLVAGPNATLENLPTGSKVGTGSLRRKAQLLRIRPDLQPTEIRGNVNTRIEKFESGEYDAVILAAAGIIRIGVEDKISQFIAHPEWHHAVAQGAIAVEIRSGDDRIKSFIKKLDHADTRHATDAERAFMLRLQGGCQVPVGVRTSIEDSTLTMSGMVSGLEGEPYLQDEISGDVSRAGKLGIQLADKLLARGAEKILDSIRSGE
ncbi:hydroxymethylbilane synthase [bacterium]